jgi:hypothetical protein
MFSYSHRPLNRRTMHILLFMLSRRLDFREIQMNQLLWLEACARRLSELRGVAPDAQSEQTVTRLWYSEEGSKYRKMHPVAAAEAWFAAHGRREKDTHEPAGPEPEAPSRPRAIHTGGHGVRGGP